ncbi:MAG TPA: adenylate/guanylate cyclase domain-containing protein [Stellaceae bacterium]|nr:adenylate/guanylate cyclase domain-containing protein [Stellaceae bacterium]
MSLLKTRKLRLRSSIVVLFAVLITPVFFAIITLNYISNKNIARDDANALIARFRTETIDSIQGMFNPIKSLIRSAAMVGNQQPGFYADNRSLKYLLSVLLHSNKVVSIYVGLADGSFRQARRINPTVKVQGGLPPAGVKYAYRWIAPEPGSKPLDHYIFLDEQHTQIGTTAQPTTYDPRPRLWYRQTAENHKLIITDPEVFAALGLIGFTIAAPIYTDGKVTGVAAADITLDGLSQFLAERKISPGTSSYILDTRGGVLANSALAKTYTNDDGTVTLQPITSLGGQLPAIAYSARPRDTQKSYSFFYRGKEYIASCSMLPVRFGKHWQLFTVTPLSDFTGPFDHNAKLLFEWGLVAIVIEILIIYFLSAVISSPLERLATNVTKIESLGAEDVPPLRSPFSEISVLSKAIDTLGATVESFAAFVPVSLVKQLINSDRRVELGGHSRFLTIFFTDLESFSTLSEEVPTQELMRRLSAYLELVTRAVNAEAGTIDKFIGDGVMAFWGAPALLEDHAWHACVAALRIQHGMDALNEGWQAAELKPLKVRIGIHCDAVQVGNIGSRVRMDYTVIGDGVNIAARLEGVNKEYGTRICISHNVFKEAGDRLCVRPIDDVTVKGRRAQVQIYELMGAYGSGADLEPTPETVRLCRLTRLAHEALIHDDRPLALSGYREILDEFPNDTVARALISRLTGVELPHRLPAQAAD